MEKSERETHDFMNVESFSQLPFIRPAPLKEKGIRLFGKEFGGDSGGVVVTTNESDSIDMITVREEVKETDNNGESSRKFKCHYCCRNFPTSQALGGHQNAHKRERQHAKRAHVQSAMVHGSFADAHMYGIMNYHRLASAPSPSMTYHNHSHSWNNPSNAYSTTNTSSSNRFYGGHGSFSQQQPINGSPLGLWRIPTVQNSPTFNHHDRGLNPSLLATATDELKGSSRMVSSSDSSQGRYLYESKPSVQQDHLSLDLHL